MAEILTLLFATQAGILTSCLSSTPYGIPSLMQERSPTTDPYGPIRCFGFRLSPEHLRRAITRPVSYYALFKWWLLLSQHPGCLRNLHFLGLH